MKLPPAVSLLNFALKLEIEPASVDWQQNPPTRASKVQYLTDYIFSSLIY